MSVDCTINAAGCVVCPPIPPVIGHPAQIITGDIIGWNAGANSILELDGDIHVVYQIPAGVLGVAMGFRPGRDQQATPGLITHGFFFTPAGALDFLGIVERGSQRINLIARAATDTFEIRRVSGQVTYLRTVSGVTTPLYVSTVPSSGLVVVNACVYHSGEAVE